MRLCNIALACLITVPALSMATNQVYRWKDANGVVHFADAPPAHGVKYKLVNIDTGVTSEPAKPTPPATAKPAVDTGKDTPGNRAKLCSALKANIDTLKSNQVITANPNSTAPLSAEQRATTLARTEAQYKDFCSK